VRRNTRIAPELDYAEFKKLEGVVNAEIDKSLPEKARRFSKFLESLTMAQREALEHVYLKNEYGLTQEDVAKKLGISIHSLTDRLEGARKKLKGFYPEFKKKKAPRKPAQVDPPVAEQSGVVISGPADDETVVTLINPATKERTRITVEKSSKLRMRLRLGVNKFEIRRWIRERCPIPYPAI
jgi:predicted DNA-binding protein (UPF0251 family)